MPEAIESPEIAVNKRISALLDPSLQLPSRGAYHEGALGGERCLTRTQVDSETVTISFL